MGKGDFFNKFQKAMEIPQELLHGYPRITALGAESVLIENYKAIVEYESSLIRISNHVCIYGSELNIEEITAEDMLLSGKIKSIEFED